ncbi:MAG: di-trans,poly-cis-decaprenylcistransferase [Alphaproteobacteria bacterium]|nr:di-trans,poly-cis-decaprenylcistransferase [Alphaproteobacteria bacterium]
MDGNRRWAKQRGLPVVQGHKKGADVLVEIAEAVRDAGIKYMTVYAFSTENWQRSAEEVEHLMNLLRQYLDTGFKKLQESDARIVFIGEREMLASDITAKMAKIERETAANQSVTLCVALSYGGRQEIATAARRVAEKVQKGELAPDEIDCNLFAKYLYTSGIPDPDLMVRTGGEMRVSNYLPWQLSYSEFYFSDTLWPDFKKDELIQIIGEYSKRERRYGKS